MSSHLVKSSSIEAIIDSETPANAELCPKYKRSFAYATITDRVPVIVTGIIDHLSKEKNVLIPESDQAEAVREDVKGIIAELSELKYQIQTGKPLVRLAETGDPDASQWNCNINEKESEVGELTYYTGSWLFVECFIYRRIHEIISSKCHMKHWDPFSDKKNTVLYSSLNAVSLIADHLVCNKILESQPLKTSQLIEELSSLIKFSLWANKYDLSLSSGNTDIAGKGLHEWDGDLLVNDMDQLIEHLYTTSDDCEDRIIDFVLDNAAMELLCDLCLADFLVVRCRISHIRFHCKKMPWFVSDVTKNDFDKTIKVAMESSNSSLRAMAIRWNDYIKKGTWTLDFDDFWTRGLPYDQMEKESPKLYQELQQSYLVILKGDLNYRKAVRDRAWSPTESLASAVGSFRPSTVTLLRTMKADTVAGLPDGVAENVSKTHPDWMVTGKFGLIQFLPSL